MKQRVYSSRSAGHSAAQARRLVNSVNLPTSTVLATIERQDLERVVHMRIARKGFTLGVITIEKGQLYYYIPCRASLALGRFYVVAAIKGKGWTSSARDEAISGWAVKECQRYLATIRASHSTNVA